MVKFQSATVGVGTGAEDFLLDACLSVALMLVG